MKNTKVSENVDEALGHQITISVSNGGNSMSIQKIKFDKNVVYAVGTVTILVFFAYCAGHVLGEAIGYHLG